MSRIVACGRRLLADRCGTALIGYSSIMLLVAIAAIAMLTQFRSDANLGGANLPPTAESICRFERVPCQPIDTRAHAA
ncbi:MAG: hypothetical protein Q8K93_31305 [Reyranella sp.]|nr:hypothetical protein [Reyranella sp.]